MATVTALRRAGPNRVAVEVDGAPWRTLPAQAVLNARLRVGAALDRPTLRLLRRELRRAEALAVATRILATSDQSALALRKRLERRGIEPRVRQETVQVLERSGLVDDRRTAAARAQALAARGYGDAAIAADLERRGFDRASAAAALAALEPESERAAEIAAHRGTSPKTAHFLASKGFSDEAVEAACGVDFANDP
jgi:SOS response regulatory protein OraA/RecX